MGVDKGSSACVRDWLCMTNQHLLLNVILNQKEKKNSKLSSVRTKSDNFPPFILSQTTTIATDF